jgi:outer membrane protein assembly factor BamD
MLNQNKKIKIFIFTILIFGSLVLLGCSGGLKYNDLSMDASWVKIKRYYDRGRFLDAVDHLEIFLINYAGSALADSAQYLLAESHFNMKEFIISSAEYEKLIFHYPQSTLAEVSEYKLGLSYYKLSPKFSLDQSFTQQSLETFQLFLDDYPNSALVTDATEMMATCRDKMAHKEFYNGMLYQKMGEFTSAKVYYEIVMNDFYDTKYAMDAHYYKAYCYEKIGEITEALAVYNSFLDKYQDNEYSNLALIGLNRCRKKISNQ